MRTEHDSLQEEHSASTSELEICKGFLKDDEVLPLPSSYKFLEDVYRCTEQITTMLHNRNETITFEKLKVAVQ